ncbi:unnamed protein product [Heligmosomoides polygyrus]|uniref:ABC transmembrane type-1 domain-containing protein n=1 Tax=Heligmosomoides polygyrus TaxID=6339 RepID=A0A3P7ZI68_HELPZ|nr:unnamed protein product [Heligmosomoides polygyrus]
MLLFNPGGLRSQAQELRSKLGNLLFGVRHLRPFEACLSSLECSAFSLIVGLHAAVLFPGTVGWMCSCPILTALLVVPPVFKERVFGTPPLKEFNRMEFARCSNLSDSLIDDIFGDYEPNVTLH